MKKKAMAFFMASFMLVTIFGASFSVQSAESVKDSMPETSENEIQSSETGDLTIHVVIKDEYFEYNLPNAIVTIVTNANGFVRIGRTNIFGEKTIRNVPIGAAFKLTIFHVGFKTIIKEDVFILDSYETWKFTMHGKEDIGYVRNTISQESINLNINSVSNNLLPVQESVEPTENSISETPENEIEPNPIITRDLTIHTYTRDYYFEYPAARIKVEVVKSSGGISRVKYTNVWGKANFYNLEIGCMYCVTLSRPGYKTKGFDKVLESSGETWDVLMMYSEDIPQVDINSVSNNLVS